MEYPTYTQQLREIERTIDLSGLTDVSNSGSASNLLTTAYISENARLAQFGRRVGANGFLQNATGIYLDLHGEKYGLRRGGAVSATVFAADRNLKLSVESGTLREILGSTIAANTEISDAAGNRRYLTPTIAVPAGVSELYITAAALTPGTASNVNPGELSVISLNAPGLTVTNEFSILTGRDAESDSSFRRRLLSHVQGTRVVSGSSLVSLALGIPGVSNAFISNSAFGINSPALVIAGPDRIRAGVVNQVQAIVNQILPFGTRVEVITPTYRDVEIELLVETSKAADRPVTSGLVESHVRQYFGGSRPGRDFDMSDLDAFLTRRIDGILDVKVMTVYVDGRQMSGSILQVDQHEQVVISKVVSEVV